jgi:hypothetical protein
LHAQWTQLDLERGILFLLDSKTGQKPIYLSAAAQAVIGEIPLIGGNLYIIVGTKGGAPRADLKRPWTAVIRAAGLEGVRIHDLRHSFASFGAGSLGLPFSSPKTGPPATLANQYGDKLRYCHDTGARFEPDGAIIPLSSLVDSKRGLKLRIGSDMILRTGSARARHVGLSARALGNRRSVAQCRANDGNGQEDSLKFFEVLVG